MSSKSKNRQHKTNKMILATAILLFVGVLTYAIVTIVVAYNKVEEFTITLATSNPNEDTFCLSFIKDDDGEKEFCAYEVTDIDIRFASFPESVTKVYNDLENDEQAYAVIRRKPVNQILSVELHIPNNSIVQGEYYKLPCEVETETIN